MTCQCLESVKAQTKDVSYEIILVDNASTDGSREYFGQRDDLIYIYSDENLGFGKANNLGFSKASGKYLLLLNSDTILNNNAVKLFYDFMESAPSDIACCGSFLRDRELKVIHSYGRFHTFWNAIVEWYLVPYMGLLGMKFEKYDYPVAPSDGYAVVEFITGADLFIRRDILGKYGLFDSDFFMYSEDMDLCRRYRDAGYKSVIIEAPRIIHLEGSSYKGNNESRNRMAINSLCLYMRKRMNRVEYMLFRFLLSLKVKSAS
ncbi:MAG: glycosyltransferase family 2 protein [Prevotella sp.]|nr:glycosyltransferase family 2 protein [Prevotella sp.]